MERKIHDLFGPGSHFHGRTFREYPKIAEIVEACRQLDLKIVLTSGTYDLFHVGHSRYLEKAKQHGDVLIVGVDSDEKVRQKKGPQRPVVSEDERMEILCHSRHVDLVFLKQADDPRWQLIKTIRPDTLIATRDVYTEEEAQALKEYCGEVVILESQATTSTTAKIRSVLIGPVGEVKKRLRVAIEEVEHFLDELAGRA